MEGEMKTIEQRAAKWGEYIAERTTYDVVAAKYSYIAGANAQKEIDDAELLKLKSSWEEEAQINHNDKSNYKQGYHDAIEKACEWFSDYLFEIGYPNDWKRDSENIISGEQRFRKAMKKELWKRWKE